MKTHLEGKNTKPAVCRNCGQPLAPREGLVYEVWGYPWDGSDTEGSITEMLDSYAICIFATDCAERVVERGTNLRALRRIASDRENLGELADRARQILREWSDLAQAEAHTADLVAREDGWGAIGHV